MEQIVPELRLRDWRRTDQRNLLLSVLLLIACNRSEARSGVRNLDAMSRNDTDHAMGIDDKKVAFPSGE
jgi:hypothetical protein